MVSTTVRVVNDKNTDVKSDGEEIGEIIVKGPGVSGTEDEWLRTGDMGTIDEKGHVTIVNRKKDIVLNGKHSISSFDVEHAINMHPAVREAAVIVAPHKQFGEILHAIVVLHESNSLTEEDLFLHLREKLDETECPKEITFMDELPKTPSGKIQKLQLRELI